MFGCVRQVEDLTHSPTQLTPTPTTSSFLTIEWFGPLTCSIFTKTQKCFTLLCSVLIFGNSITVEQMIGAVFVFLGLTLEQFFGNSKHK
jgi:drug/metabolite transporter (DMT)-like permease